MRPHIYLRIVRHDHPIVTKKLDEETLEQELTIELSDEVQIIGEEGVVRRWVREVAAQVAALEE